MKHTILAIIIASGISMTACKKQLDIIPENSLTYRNGIETEKDIEDLVLSVSNTVRKEMYSFDHMLPVDGYADENDDGGWGSLFRPNAIVAGWDWKYKVINQANIPLNFMEQTNTPENRKTFYRGQLYFYKALAYLEIIRMFGDCVLVKEEIVMDPVAKSPWTEVADYAIELARQAVDMLPELSQVRDSQGRPATDKAVPCKGAANAVLANLCAWKAGCKYIAQPAQRDYDENKLWEEAEDACTAIINSKEYDLAADPAVLCESGLVGGTPESIFEINYLNYWNEMFDKDGNKMGTPVGGPFQLYQSWYLPNQGLAAIAQSYYRIYASTAERMFPPNDLRRYSYFYKLDSLSAEPVSQGYAYPYKYRKLRLYTSGDRIGQVDRYDQNFILYRMGGIYLLRAECRARLGKNGDAIADLDKVRGRAHAAPYNSAEGDLRYIIYKEREKELLFEPNYFYYDIIRNGYARTELRRYDYDKASDQDLIDGAFFNMIDIERSGNANPLMRQNTYWNKRFH